MRCESRARRGGGKESVCVYVHTRREKEEWCQRQSESQREEEKERREEREGSGNLRVVGKSREKR